MNINTFLIILAVIGSTISIIEFISLILKSNYKNKVGNLSIKDLNFYNTKERAESILTLCKEDTLKAKINEQNTNKLDYKLSIPKLTTKAEQLEDDLNELTKQNHTITTKLENKISLLNLEIKDYIKSRNKIAQSLLDKLSMDNPNLVNQFQIEEEARIKKEKEEQLRLALLEQEKQKELRRLAKIREEEEENQRRKRRRSSSSYYSSSSDSSSSSYSSSSDSSSSSSWGSGDGGGFSGGGSSDSF